MIKDNSSFIERLLSKQSPPEGVKKEEFASKTLSFMYMAWDLFAQIKPHLIKAARASGEEALLIEECFNVSTHASTMYFRLLQEGVAPDEIDDFTNSVIAEWIES
ncbi:MAG: hypothetical protein ACTTIC_08020 [Helicobacteraceae bacterium]